MNERPETREDLQHVGLIVRSIAKIAGDGLDKLAAVSAEDPLEPAEIVTARRGGGVGIGEESLAVPLERARQFFDVGGTHGVIDGVQRHPQHGSAVLIACHLRTDGHADAGAPQESRDIPQG